MSKSNQSPVRTPQLAVAACTFDSVEVQSGHEVQLLPAGTFRARDGRPKNAPYWVMDASTAEQMIAAASARQNDYVTDYDHQTLRAKENGKPAPAAGWFKDLVWREGDGLYATDMRWTAAASTGIDNKEFRYISPVFSYEPGTGRITGLLMAALTNEAAIDGMQDVIAAATALIEVSPTTEKDSDMEALLERLQWLLNLPVGATAEDILAQLDKLKEKLQAATADTEAAASFDLIAYLGTQDEQIAALSTATPDPTKFVPLEAYTALQQHYAALNTQVGANQLDTLIEDGLAAGKLLPAQVSWARQMGTKDIAALSTFLDASPSIAALGGLQTGGKEQPGHSIAALTTEQKQLCLAMGVTEDAYLKTLQATSQA